MARALEQALLHRQMPSIGRFTHLAERFREVDGKRASEGDPELSLGETDPPTSPEFDAADPRLMDTDACPELSLGETEANASRPHDSRKRLGDVRRQASGLTHGFGRPTPRPCRGFHAQQSCIRVFTATYVRGDGIGADG